MHSPWRISNGDDLANEASQQLQFVLNLSRFHQKISIGSRLLNACEKSDFPLEGEKIWAFLLNFIENGSHEFFVEWTDHSIKHLQSIFDSIEVLTTKAEPSFLNGKEAFCLVTSVLLHDIAMRFDLRAFASLISPSAEWSDQYLSAWLDFCNECQHWDRQKVVDTYGNDALVPSVADVNELREANKKIVGEFLRRMHGEIAFEVAKRSFAPIIQLRQSTYLRTIDDGLSELLIISGHIARSHTWSLRAALDQVRRDFELEELSIADCNSVFSVRYPYLMVLLRVADILDFRNSTTQQFLQSTKTLESPISQLEFDTMSAFRDALWSSSREQVTLQYKTISPRIERHFSKQVGVAQFEIDTSWAVLSEYFGSEDDPWISRSGLNIRRIKAKNLSSKELKRDFHTRLFNVSVSDASVIFLLAGPLYNGDPLFGLREVLSNSHDACLEAKSRRLTFEDTLPISLRIDSVGNVISIDDQGIGMSEDELDRFFLRVGGRLRDTLEWKSTSSSDSNTRYPFTSRFGVGFVSLFMLGNSIRIHTCKEGHSAVDLQISQSNRELNAKKTPKNRGTLVSIDANSGAIAKIIEAGQSAFRAREAFLDRSSSEDIYWSTLFQIDFLKFVLMDVPLRLQVEGDLFRDVTVTDFNRHLERQGIAWCQIALSELSSNIECMILCRPSTASSTHSKPINLVVYNGIPVRVPTFRYSGFGDILVIRDVNNQLRMSLQKTEFSNFSNQDATDVYAEFYWTQIERRSKLNEDHVVEDIFPLISPWKEHFIKFSDLPFIRFNTPLTVRDLYEADEFPSHGYFPRVFFYRGKALALTIDEFDSVATSQIAVIAATEEVALEVLSMFPQDVPLLLLLMPEISKTINSTKPIDANVESVLSWRSKRRRRKGDWKIDSRAYTLADQRIFSNMFSTSRLDAVAKEALLRRVQTLESQGKCSGIGLLRASELRKCIRENESFPHMGTWQASFDCLPRQ